jgi:hypothetical protein
MSDATIASTEPIVMMPKPPIWISSRITSSPNSENRRCRSSEPGDGGRRRRGEQRVFEADVPGPVGRDRQPSRRGADGDEGDEGADDELRRVPDRGDHPRVAPRAVVAPNEQ